MKKIKVILEDKEKSNWCTEFIKNNSDKKILFLTPTGNEKLENKNVTVGNYNVNKQRGQKFDYIICQEMSLCKDYEFAIRSILLPMTQEKLIITTSTTENLKFNNYINQLSC